MKVSGKRENDNFMNTVTEQHIVYQLLKPNKVVLSMHKPFELVFLICLG